MNDVSSLNHAYPVGTYLFSFSEELEKAAGHMFARGIIAWPFLYLPACGPEAFVL